MTSEQYPFDKIKASAGQSTTFRVWLEAAISLVLECHDLPELRRRTAPNKSPYAAMSFHTATLAVWFNFPIMKAIDEENPAKRIDESLLSQNNRRPDHPSNIYRMTSPKGLEDYFSVHTAQSNPLPFLI